MDNLNFTVGPFNFERTESDRIVFIRRNKIFMIWLYVVYGLRRRFIVYYLCIIGIPTNSAADRVNPTYIFYAIYTFKNNYYTTQQQGNKPAPTRV